MLYMAIFYPINHYFWKGEDTCPKNSENLLNLAWNLLSKNCAKVFESLKKVLVSEEFKEKHRINPDTLTRQRKLPFHITFCFIMNLLKGSYQDELDRFFQAIFRSPVAKRVVSKAAFSKARMKFSHQAFVDLNSHLVTCFEKIFEPITWHGFRLLAIDGSTLKLARLKAFISHFGVWNVHKGEPRPMARISQLFDPLNKITVAAVIDPKEVGEREQAAQLFLNLLQNDLVLLDRGYPAFWLFKIILSMDANFCARISNKWKIVRQFINSGKKEKTIRLFPASSSTKSCHEMGMDLKPITLRLIRIELDSGETEVLITSLVNRELHPYEVFAELYHARWPVEEDYKVIKHRIEELEINKSSVLS